MNYAVGYALGLKDLFKNLSFKKLKMSVAVCQKLIKNRHKEIIMAKVMKLCIKLIIDDIIYNNATFKLPTGKKKAFLYMKKTSDDNFVGARKNGKWKDVDFLASNFSGYQMAFKYQTGGVMRERPVYLDSSNKKLITDKTNEGKQYF